MRHLTPNGLRLAVAWIVAAGGCAGMPSAAADDPICLANVCAFYSPSHNISCEIDYQRGAGMPDEAYCQTMSPHRSVHMDPTGAFTVCTGETCLGNPGLGQATLPYGETAGIGAFSCRSEVSGITCRVASGRGFTISSSGITPAG
ncbi:hypothetical protein [Mycobacterium sp. SP-6446]|uniref:hypothetical protein n=1 Tax=Mycobacterium sp. SP-6446 TaxID=1834162 RepID=UPI00096C0D2E|nr:hypothetical protein [Mycobacterium sp. SP-6446]OMC20195.1 hypothetical protein A5736_12640 [Mycobacterium sp. SP-6446]